ncbi:hypothetical protein K491DRAFT_677648 [Lophiostoma macrostomum CBS 122681]|uniref:Uncharacterized protein n=1 Tax=Lophiostoma macrostomum CBS 122681 TaxID=1314788 RepID=A0A6A6TDE7_9PLEO|nr:hypothetical protein K491DRAFT_677648 [Lophiostoma macrostomum CBS 122681]
MIPPQDDDKSACRYDPPTPQASSDPLPLPDQRPELPTIDYPCCKDYVKTQKDQLWNTSPTTTESCNCSTRKSVDLILQICSLQPSPTPPPQSIQLITTKSDGIEYDDPDRDVNAIVDPLRNEECFYVPIRSFFNHEDALIDALHHGDVSEASSSCYILRALPKNMHKVAVYSFFAWRVAFWDPRYSLSYPRYDGKTREYTPEARRGLAKAILPGLQKLRSDPEMGKYFKVPVRRRLSHDGDEAYEASLHAIVAYQSHCHHSDPNFFNQEKSYRHHPYLDEHIIRHSTIRDVPDREKVLNHIRWMVWSYWKWRLQGGRLGGADDEAVDQAFVSLEKHVSKVVLKRGLSTS